MDVVCRLFEAHYYKDNVEAHMGVVHLDSRTLDFQYTFTRMVCLKAADCKFKNPIRRSSFPNKVLYSEFAALLKDLNKVNTLLNYKFH